MEWMPIEREYPVKFEEVIYSTVDRVEIGFYDGSSWHCYNLGMVDDMSSETEEVIAWMPIPEPYKATN